MKRYARWRRARTVLLLSCTLATALVPAAAARAAQLVRGPYLQRGIVRSHRGALAHRRRLGRGRPLRAVAEQLDQSQDGPLWTRITRSSSPVWLPTPATSSPSGPRTRASPAAIRSTASAPRRPRARRTPPRIWVLGDSGTAGADARAVRDGYLAFNGGRLHRPLADAGRQRLRRRHGRGVPAGGLRRLPGVLRGAVLWPTLGNHDAHSADSATESGPYFDIFTLPRDGEAGGLPSGTEAYYSFDYANVHFVCLDSAEGDLAPDGAMLTWLADDLAAAQARLDRGLLAPPALQQGIARLGQRGAT